MKIEEQTAFICTYIRTYQIPWRSPGSIGTMETAKNAGSMASRSPTLRLFFQKGHAIVPDVKHSNREDRFIAISRDANGRALFVAFTLRQQGKLVRPVSARYMHQKESDAYAKESSTHDD